MAENGRGARKTITPQMRPNPKYQYALEKAWSWAVHSDAQFAGPYPGDTPEEVQRAQQECMAVAYNAREMSIMWTRLAAVLPTQVEVVEDGTSEAPTADPT